MGLWLERFRAVVGAHELGRWWAFQVVAMGLCLAWFVRRTPSVQARLRPCLLAGFAGAGVGAFALGVILRVPAWVRARFDLEVLFRGELMAWGALLGLVLVYASLARRRGLDPDDALDRLAPPVGLLVAVARLGCFVAGCDFGTVTRVPWGVRYPAGSAAFRHQLADGLVAATDAVSLPVHPAQLYEAGVGLAMAAFALATARFFARRAPRPGAAFTAAAITYAVGRFAVELFRGDDRGALGPLSTPQCLSLAVLAWLAVRALSASPDGPASGQEMKERERDQERGQGDGAANHGEAQR